MPLLRYFMFVGGALLMLLFAISAFAPPPAVEAAKSSADLSIIRIHSDQKWPERVVFDTTRPTMPAPQNVVATTMPTVVPQTPPPQTTQKSASVAPLKKAVREAFAQVTSADQQRKAKRKSLARNNPPMMIVAQQPHFGLFGNTW